MGTIVFCYSLLATEPNWTLTTGIFSEYLARPGFDLYDKPVSQNEITASWHGLYGGIWSSSALEYSSTIKYGQEFQTYIGLKKPIGWITLDGNIRYDALKELSSDKDDLWMVDMRMDITKMSFIQPYIATRYFHPVSSEKPTSGWFVWFGARRIQDIGFGFPHCNRITLIVDGSVTHSDGVLSRDPGWVYSRFCLQMNIPVSKHLTISPQFTTQIPLDDQNKGHHPYTDGTDHFVGSITATLRF